MKITMTEIKSVVADETGLTVQQLVSPARFRHFAWPRQTAMALARELTDKSLPEIGRAFSDRDHTTVMYAVREVQKRNAKCAETRKTYEQIKSRINAEFRATFYRHGTLDPMFKSRRAAR